METQVVMTPAQRREALTQRAHSSQAAQEALLWREQCVGQVQTRRAEVATEADASSRREPLELLLAGPITKRPRLRPPERTPLDQIEHHLNKIDAFVADPAGWETFALAIDELRATVSMAIELVQEARVLHDDDILVEWPSGDARTAARAAGLEEERRVLQATPRRTRESSA